MSHQPPRKFGQGALEAAGRQGLKELGQALKPLPDSLPIVEEPGQIGTATPQAVSDQMGFSNNAYPTNQLPERSPYAEPSMLESLMNEVQQMPDSPEMQQEMSQ